MPYESKLRPGEELIDDNNWQRLAPPQRPDGGQWGLMPRDWKTHPLGCSEYAAVSQIEIIPRKDWPEMIRENESKRQQMSDLVLDAGIPSTGQNGTNYCWFFAYVTALETMRCAAGMPYVKLSGASGAAQIKNYRNEGGWGLEALEWVATKGICPASLWPTTAIDRRYATPAAAEAALSNRITEWWDIPDRHFDALASALLYKFVGPIGLNWWSHEVCAFDLVALPGGKFGVRIRNSWDDSWGDRGFSVLTESRATPDGCEIPRVPLLAA